MPKIVFGSRKGGTGKTTCAHTLAAGLSLLQQRAVMVTVDLRPVRGTQGRPYGILDGREESRLFSLLERELAQDEWLVFDLGATRTGVVDTVLADFVDLFICPVSPDLEALEIGVDYLNQHPRVMALPSIWPTNARAAQVDSYILDTLEQHHPGRVGGALGGAPRHQNVLGEPVDPRGVLDAAPEHLPRAGQASIGSDRGPGHQQRKSGRRRRMIRANPAA